MSDEKFKNAITQDNKSGKTILVLDTVHRRIDVRLVLRDGTLKVCEGEVSMRPDLDQKLGGVVRELLLSAGIAVSDVDIFAVVVGPGSWTGARVGVSAVKAYLMLGQRPVVELNSLEIAGLNFNGEGVLAMKSGRDNYFVMRNVGGDNVFLYEKLSNENIVSQNIKLFSDIDRGEYERNKMRVLFEKIENGEFAITPEPLYVTDFVVD